MRLTKEDLSLAFMEMIAPRISRGIDGRIGVDFRELTQELDRVFRTLTDTLDKIGDAVNANDGSSIVADALPTASVEYLGRFVTLRMAVPAADQLHWCQKDAAGAYVWYQIV